MRILSLQPGTPYDMVLASELNDIDSHSTSERLSTMPECISLLRSPLGQTVRLQSLAPLHPSLRRRLTDMGIDEGSIIRLKKISLLGGPIVIECNGQLVGLRQNQVKQLEVVPTWT
ncbi:ferrous iron transport protein A [Paenibacillus brasilensis]|uniref:Ferrous iron transport protein A n=2 Tax=Paenibacillus brasilensis TaxID=128574 RepID=A0ABU0L000_9BACL|nr:ferrous iron transport protein A [Paenibacillus brasilensis]